MNFWLFIFDNADFKDSLVWTHFHGYETSVGYMPSPSDTFKDNISSHVITMDLPFGRPRWLYDKPIGLVV